MRELAILTFTTLDGVMQAPVEPWEDRSDGFSSAGWAKPYWDGVMSQVASVAMADPYDAVLGRRTYDNFFRASQESAGESPLDAVRKYVVTSSEAPLEWANSVKITGDIAASFQTLKSEGGVMLQVHGSWQLIQYLLAHDLIDEFRIWTFPVVLGEGKRLFPSGAPPRDLTLVRAEPTGNGAAMSIYRRA